MRIILPEISIIASNFENATLIGLPSEFRGSRQKRKTRPPESETSRRFSGLRN